MSHVIHVISCVAEIQPVILRFKKLRSRKGKKTVDLELAHAYSQWQSCLRHSFTLNQLLNHPVPEPELALYAHVSLSLTSGANTSCVTDVLRKGGSRAPPPSRHHGFESRRCKK